MRSRRAGVTLVDVLVGVAIFAALFMPAYTLFIQSRNTAFKSKLAYMGIHAAREEIEDLRILMRVMKEDEIVTKGGDSKLAHGWKKFEGSAMDRLKDVRGPSASGASAELSRMAYPEEYKRIWTKVDIQPTNDPFVYSGVLHVRWQEKGEQFGSPADEKSKKGFSRFDFFLVRPHKG